jgi:hypothetical protein
MYHTKGDKSKNPTGVLTMLKYLLPTACLLLTACVMPSTTPPVAGDPLNQICKNLKQDIIKDSVNNVPDELGHNPTEQARLYKEYDKYHCDEVLAKRHFNGNSKGKGKPK